MIASDPQAQKSSEQNPVHQSELQGLLMDGEYQPAGGGVFASTVRGTAFHHRQADACREQGPVKSIADYFAGELANYPKVDWEGHTQAEMVREAEQWSAALDPVFSPRATYGFMPEVSFKFRLPENGCWYEGTIDVLHLELAAGRIKSVSLWDYKTGVEQPDFRMSPQHHLYCLALKHGVLDNVPYIPGHHLLDWTKSTLASAFYVRQWPKQFRYIHLPPLVTRTAAWNLLALGTDSQPMTIADSTAYINVLTQRLLDKQPTRLAVAIPDGAEPQPEKIMQPQTQAMIPAQPIHAPKYELTTQEIVSQGAKIQEVMRAAMKIDEDYGIIPGTSRKDKDGNEKAKPTLLKPGAEKLLLLFRLAPTFEITKTADGDHREIFVRCKLTHIVSGDFVGEGVGECSTRESKYAWRQADRKCPKCESATLRKFDRVYKKPESGKEWVCYEKQGGCGARFPENDETITKQEVGRKPNPDIADTYNTVTKMACKRALVMAVLNTTGASFLFTQDLEDFAPDQDFQAEPIKPVAAEVSTPAPQPAAPQYSWGEPRGEGFATDAQIKRLRANCETLGFSLAKVIKTATSIGAASDLTSVADLPAALIVRLILKTEELLKKAEAPRPEREKTAAELLEEQVRQIVGPEIRTKRAKELAEIIRSGPLSVEQIVEIMENEAAPDTQFTALPEAQQEQLLHTIKRAADSAASRAMAGAASNGNGSH